MAKKSANRSEPKTDTAQEQANAAVWELISALGQFTPKAAPRAAEPKTPSPATADHANSTVFRLLVLALAQTHPDRDQLMKAFKNNLQPVWSAHDKETEVGRALDNAVERILLVIGVGMFSP